MKGIFQQINNEELLFDVSLNIYDLIAIKEAVYRFTARGHVFLEDLSEESVKVHIKGNGIEKIKDLACSFVNELMEQQIRCDIEKKFGNLRDKIVERAFSHVIKKK